jgi:hypothetical protein
MIRAGIRDDGRRRASPFAERGSCGWCACLVLRRDYVALCSFTSIVPVGAPLAVEKVTQNGSGLNPTSIVPSQFPNDVCTSS